MGGSSVSCRIRSFLKRWENDYAFKTLIGSAVSCCITVMFAMYNGYLGISLLSVWHGSICAFYVLLFLIRGSILLTEKRNMDKSKAERERSGYRTFKISAFLLLLLNLSLIFPISYMAVLARPAAMGLIPAIIMAVYTTYKLTMAAVHMRKQKLRSHKNLLIAQLRTINLIDALVSVLALQNTLIMVSGAESDIQDSFVLSIVSSGLIYILILITTLSLAAGGFRQIKKNRCLKNRESGER